MSISCRPSPVVDIDRLEDVVIDQWLSTSDPVPVVSYAVASVVANNSFDGHNIIVEFQ